MLGSAVVVLVVAAMLLGRWQASRSPSEERPPTAIAVLPFKNLSAEGPHFFFASGLHDEVLTQLTRVEALDVMGRTSVMAYEGTDKRLSEIGLELGAGSLVEGSVQVGGDRLRVIVQLIDPITETHLWAETYDRTLDDAFAVQSDIARKIAMAVGARLSRAEAEAIATAPTGSAEAYRLYLQGLEYQNRPGRLRANFEIAQSFFEGALALDSTFALAHAALSRVHGSMWWFRYDPSPDRLTRQGQSAETALRLDPQLPQVHRALGRFHYQRGDWQAALEQYHVALESMPNSAEMWEEMAYAHRRLGDWEQALAILDRLVVLDPLDATAYWDLGGTTLSLLHRYEGALAWADRAIALRPDVPEMDVWRGELWVRWQGGLDSLTAALDRHPPDADLGSEGDAYMRRAMALLWERNADSLLALLPRVQQPAFESQEHLLPGSLFAAWAHRLHGHSEASRTAFDSALVLLDSVAGRLPEDWRVHAARGLVLAGLQRTAEARREAHWLQESASYQGDRYSGPTLAEYRSMILAAIHDNEAALEEIERLLAGPSGLSVHTLRLDPRWDPIRDDPRFQALLVKYADPEGRR